MEGTEKINILNYSILFLRKIFIYHKKNYLRIFFRDSAIIAADGRIIHTEDIYSKFNNSNCPALLGKPKFFVIQACRGEETDRSNMMEYQEDELMHEASNELKVKRAKRRWDACDDSIPITMEPLDQCRPTWEDMIIAYSTIPGYTSQRDPQEGT